MYHPVTMQVFDNLNPRCLRMPLSLTVKHILSAGIRLLSESLIVAVRFPAVRFPAGCDQFSCLFNYFCCCCCCCVFCFSYLTRWFLKLVKQFESEINHSSMVRQFKLPYRKSIASRSNWSEKFCSEKFYKIHTQAPAMVSSEVTFTFPKIIAPSQHYSVDFGKFYQTNFYQNTFGGLLLSINVINPYYTFTPIYFKAFQILY